MARRQVQWSAVNVAGVLQRAGDLPDLAPARLGTGGLSLQVVPLFPPEWTVFPMDAQPRSVNLTPRRGAFLPAWTEGGREGACSAQCPRTRPVAPRHLACWVGCCVPGGRSGCVAGAHPLLVFVRQQKKRQYFEGALPAD